MLDVDHVLLSAFLAAFGGGLLVGIERERNKGDGPDRAAAGVRTYTLVALMGVVGALLGNVALALAGAAVALLAYAGYERTRTRDPGLTSEIALILVFLLGALAAQRAQLAAALYVMTAIVLVSKQSLHRFTRQVLSDAELGDLLLLAASVLIVLPLLPDRTIDPFGVLNPRKLWLLVVLVMSINAAGYIALRALGARRGLLLAGFLGGFVSSTATIGGMGQRARSMPATRPSAIAAALLSNIPTVIQLAVILAALAPVLLRAFMPGLIAAGVSAAAIAALFVWRAGRTDAAIEQPTVGKRPFDIGHALMFAAIVAVALLLSAALHFWIGGGGVIVAAAATGLADVHAAAVSIGQLSATSTLPPAQATIALAVAFVANSAVKCVAAFSTGGVAYARPLIAGLAVIDLAMVTALVLSQ